MAPISSSEWSPGTKIKTTIKKTGAGTITLDAGEVGSGKEAKFVNGLRVTDAETCEIAEMVLGSVSKKLVSMVAELGIRGIGISGKDGNLLRVKKKYAGGQDIGFVGDIKKVDSKILFDLLEMDFLPIVAPVGLDDDFNTYNINADDAACEIAKAAGAEKLAFLTDIDGR